MKAVGDGRGNTPVVIFLSFANDRVEGAGYLRNLALEQRRIRAALAAAEEAGHCEVVERANSTTDDILNVFQNPRYRHRVAIFHYGGHAEGTALFLESSTGVQMVAHAAPFARFLAEQRGLTLVFLNGCSSLGQVQRLLDAGIAAVIATSRMIDDTVAAELAVRFYTAVASGAPLRVAFNEAQEAVRIRLGDHVGKSYRLPVRPHLEHEEKWPWEFHVAPGAEEHIERWSLPRSARDPLFGLPPLPEIDLPQTPFKHLHFFTREDAAIFFGRGREIRELYQAVTSPETAPIVLVFGATGAGKSSLLDAGLRPRLEASCEVVYSRRDGDLGLAGTLARSLLPLRFSPDDLGEGKQDVGFLWRRREMDSGRPLVIILDQLEEAWTRSLHGGREMAGLANLLRQVFSVREKRPEGSLLLGFRKEWLAEIQGLLLAARLPFQCIPIHHLDYDAVVEATTGLATSKRLCQRYQLTIESELPSIIANNLLEDHTATIAPVLQILLTRMWTLAVGQDRAQPRFTLAFYRHLKRKGYLIEDFVGEQLEILHGWRPELVESGLALDFLAYFTTSVGSAESQHLVAVLRRYGERPEVEELIARCQDQYLLASIRRRPDHGCSSGPDTPDRQVALRLAHDTLAPIVRRNFERSDRPGQRAARILQQRVVDWSDGRDGAPLDELDLAIAEEGEKGMRMRTVDEERLLEASRKERGRKSRLRRLRKLAAQVGFSIITVLAIVAGLMWARAESERRNALASEARAQDRARVAIAGNLLDRGDPIRANLVLLEVRRPAETPSAEAVLHQAFSEREHVRLEHGDKVKVASFSPDGLRVVTASDDRTAKIWDALTGEMITTLQHNHFVLDASFSPDGLKAVTASRDGTARIWASETGEVLHNLEGHKSWVTTASFSSDGKWIVTTSRDKTARVWNVLTGEAVANFRHTGEVLSASFHPDGSQVVTASRESAVRIWDVQKETASIVFRGHVAQTASFSPDGSRVATASRDEMTARIWDVNTGELVVSLAKHTDSVIGASFNSDGSQVVTTSRDGAGMIWHIDNSAGPKALKGHTALVWPAIFSRDGAMIVTYSKDKTARVWNSRKGTEIAYFDGHSDEILGASFNPRGSRVVTASEDKTARIWATSEKRGALMILEGHRGRSDVAAFSPDGRWIVTASQDNTARIWDVATGEEVAVFEHQAIVDVGFFSPDSSLVLTASRDSTARVWNVLTRKPPVALMGHSGGIEAASFNLDGSKVVTTSLDKSTRVWDVKTGKQISCLETATSATAVSFSPVVSKLAAAFRSGAALIWQHETGELVNLKGHGKLIYSISFSPGGDRVATASKDQTARIWDSGTGEQLVLEGHRGPVYKASFRPDGHQVVTASFDTTARIWDTLSGKEVVTLKGHTSQVSDAAFSPDGSRIVTASRDGTARIWSTATGEAVARLEGPQFGFETASFSPDGALIVAGSEDLTPSLWVASSELHRALLRGRNASCLAPSFRQKFFDESPEQAEHNTMACETCVAFFFEHLKDASPRGGWKASEEAWRIYKGCLQRFQATSFTQ